MSQKTIAFFPEAAFGPALNSVGIAQACEKLGHKAVFLSDPGFVEVYEGYGFEAYPVALSEPMEPEAMAKFWEDFINGHIPNFRKSPIDQIDNYVRDCWEAIVDSAKWAQKDLPGVLAKIKPDMICVDNVIMFPAIARSGRPWVRVISCAETELPDRNVPPYLSGLPASDAAGCAAFRNRYLETLDPVHARYNRFRRERGLGPLPEGEFLETSPHQNLLLSPAIVRHERDHLPDPGRFTFLEGCVRQEGPYRVPRMPRNHGPLVYVSFGSLGAMDMSFFESLIDVFKTMDMRFLVNVGAQIDAYSSVPDNVHLQEWFPQPSVVEQCDLFIHHGGNNSFCEALYFGTPSLILPYCWDGHDNAQRAVDTQVGARLNRWDWTPDQMKSAIAQLLSDEAMKARLTANSKTMRSGKSVRLAARKIVECATNVRS